MKPTSIHTDSAGIQATLFLRNAIAAYDNCIRPTTALLL